MATSESFIQYVLDQLSPLEGISARKMMGEYIIYLKGRIAAYAADDRLLIKPTESALGILALCAMMEPYPGAKKMILFEDIENSELLCSVLERIYEELEEPGGGRR